MDPTQSIFKYAVIEPSPVARTVVNKIRYYYIKQKHTQNRLLQQIIFLKCAYNELTIPNRIFIQETIGL